MVVERDNSSKDSPGAALGHPGEAFPGWYNWEVTDQYREAAWEHFVVGEKGRPRAKCIQFSCLVFQQRTSDAQEAINEVRKTKVLEKLSEHAQELSCSWVTKGIQPQLLLEQWLKDARQIVWGVGGCNSLSHRELIAAKSAAYAELGFCMSSSGFPNSAT